MSKTVQVFKAIPQTTMRRFLGTPSYFFLIWRWVSWLFALIWIASEHFQPYPQLATILLTITFLHTLGVTLYAPIFQFFLPGLPGLKQVRSPEHGTQHKRKAGKRRRAMLRLAPRPLAADEEADILTPIASTRNLFWDIVIYGSDVVICGLAMYFGGIYGNPHFGDGSPFYRYAISTALAAALTYRYKGGLAAAGGIEFFVLLGVLLPPLGPSHVQPNAIDLTGSLIDAPVIAVLAAYLATLLENYARSKRREQDNVRNQLALRNVSETLMQGAGDIHHLLEQSAEKIRKGGHFERLCITVVETISDVDIKNDADTAMPLPRAGETRIEVGLGEAIAQEESRLLLEQVKQTGKKLIMFTPLPDSISHGSYKLARLYLPFFKDGQIHVVLAAESTRQAPFASKQENFLNIVGAQLLVALDNLRLTERTAELAAEAERSRIARDIHDGVAQIIYMLSLNSETCAELAHRIADVSEEDNELLSPLAERLDKLVNLSKQALWETRHYMFTLKPLITGTSNLTQMLTHQLREFEAISGLPVTLAIEGKEEPAHGEESTYKTNHSSSKTVLVGTAIFRITQEALTNAYKHAGATQLHVFLRLLPHWVEIEIVDNGKGMVIASDSTGLNGDEKQAEHQRIYSGHGIRGMRERAEELGGTFELQCKESGGTHVLARIPQ